MRGCNKEDGGVGNGNGNGEGEGNFERNELKKV
jgi:hypothetical protein